MICLQWWQLILIIVVSMLIDAAYMDSKIDDLEDKIRELEEELDEKVKDRDIYY